jgi:hypothetical protein
MRNKIAAALAVVLVSVSTAAMADFTYSKDTYGSANIIKSFVPFDFGYVEWDGTISVTTASFMDGVYSGDSLLNITFDSSIPDFSFSYTGDYQPSVVVTIVNGDISSITSDKLYMHPEFIFSGETLSYTNIGKVEQRGFTSLVPEPDAATMLFATLVIFGVMGRTRSRGIFPLPVM